MITRRQWGLTPLIVLLLAHGPDAQKTARPATLARAVPPQASPASAPPVAPADLEHWRHDTFVARWRDRELRADAS